MPQMGSAGDRLIGHATGTLTAWLWSRGRR